MRRFPHPRAGDPFAPLDLDHTIVCPSCGEPNLLLLDPASAGAMIQDCEVCCRPYRLEVAWAADGRATLRVDDAAG